MTLAVELSSLDDHGRPVWYLHYSYPCRLPGEPGRGPYSSLPQAEEALHHLREAAHSYGEYEVSAVVRG